jgi:hypothetical protein
MPLASREHQNISALVYMVLLQTHINFSRLLTIFPDFLERLSHLAPIK